MKNKILILLLALAVLCPNIYAEEKDPNKLLSGIILTIAGGFVAYSGFRMADITVADMKMQTFVTTTTETTPTWVISTTGTVKNIGNVPFENISVTVIYKDNMGTNIPSGTETISLSYDLEPGASGVFSSYLTGLEYEPVFVSARFYGDYTGIYETSSPETAFVGCAVAAAGVFFICDYIFDLTDLFEQKEIKVQLSMANNGFNLITSKSF